MLDSSGNASPRVTEPRREEMRTPDEVTVMLRLKDLGWGSGGVPQNLGVVT